MSNPRQAPAPASPRSRDGRGSPPARGRPAVWLSGFRPFYLLGPAYLAWLLLVGAAAATGLVAAGPGTLPLPAGAALWHAHEMLYGFAMAIVAGTVLTALPSWAHTPELHGRSLVVLAALWGAGRLAFHAIGWAQSRLALVVVALLDSALVLVLLLRLAPQLLRGADRRFALLLPVLAGLAAANLAFHAALAAHDAARAMAALRALLWLIVVLYSLVGGVLTPIFTGNVLAARGRGVQAPFSPPLEAAALLTLVALAIADLASDPPPWVAALACTALVTQLWRTTRWRGWRAADDALVAGMNLGFAWLIVALALRAAAALGAPLPEAAWVHAFTMGALGTMMLALMTRVALRHTGRAPLAPPALRWLLALASAATLLRILSTPLGLGAPAMALAAAAWGGCLIAWWAAHARMLLAPSLPRPAAGGAGSGTPTIPRPSPPGRGRLRGGSPILSSPPSDPAAGTPGNAPLERELAELFVEALNLETPAAELDITAPLFGDGLGLDSIDILEVALAISQRYGFQLRSDDEHNVRIFRSIRSLAAHVAQHRVK